jgi:hypothetical protein
MKSFKFRYSKTVWILLCVVLLLSVSGICWNVFNLFTFINEGAFKTISYSLIILLTTFLLAFVISVMAFGRYVIKDKELIQYFGFLKSKIPLDDILTITHFKKSNKLVMYFKDAKYTVIVISPYEYDEFIVSIRKANPSISFSSKIDGEDLPE